MRLTARCIDLLKLLRSARWLTTSQIQRRFFPQASSDAVRMRLRILAVEKYLLVARRDRMSEALFTMGLEGKRVLETLGAETVALERKPPIQREHFLAINDLRLAAELTGRVKYFYAAWELPALGWNEALIPDGLVAFEEQTFALEFDRGVEGVQFFIRTKMIPYQRGFGSLAVNAVIIVADRTVRMMSLAKAIGDQRGKVLFSTLEMIKRHTLLSPIFYTEAQGWGVSLFENLSCQTLLTAREFSTRKSADISNLGFLEQGLLRQGKKEGVDRGKGSNR